MEHEELKKLIPALRSAYTPPNRKQVGGVLLDEIFKEELDNCFKILNGQAVCKSLYGWTNIINEPIICVIATSPGKKYLIKSIDTSGHSHITKYLVKRATQTITKCKTQYNCFSIVTDNANNVKSMKTELRKKSKILLMDVQHIF